jgi:hypothetical protein
MTTDNLTPQTSSTLYNSGQTLFVNNTTNESAEIVIFDTAGRRLNNYSIGVGNSTIQTKLLNGNYVVKLRTTNNIISKQILVN